MRLLSTLQFQILRETTHRSKFNTSTKKTEDGGTRGDKAHTRSSHFVWLCHRLCMVPDLKPKVGDVDLSPSAVVKIPAPQLEQAAEGDE